MNKKYTFRNSIKSEKDAETYAMFLNSLPKRDPVTQVEAARDPNSPVHEFFDWNNKTAAHSYRLWQARNYTGSLCVQIEDWEPMKAYESISIDGGRDYLAIEDIKGTQDLMDQVLKSALKELAFWKAKYQRHKDFFGDVFDIIDVAEERYRNYHESNTDNERRV